MIENDRRKFETEAALCAAFIEWAKGEGWTPYPETAGWDVLLVGRDDLQIGVQAKLRFNIKVIAQTLPEHWYSVWEKAGPDFRAVLVPEQDSAAASICGALGLVYFYDTNWGRGFAPGIREGINHGGGFHYWNPLKRHKLPEFVPDVVAGASGPTQLTEWKIKALRICAVAELRGYVTREDFNRYGLDHRRWTGPDGWLVANGTAGQWRWRDSGDAFSAQHPIVYPQVRDAVRAELAAMRPERVEGNQGRLVA